MQALSTWMCDVDMSLSKSSCIAYRLCFSYAFPMISLCFSYAFPMLFPMDFEGFSSILQGVPLRISIAFNRFSMDFDGFSSILQGVPLRISMAFHRFSMDFDGFSYILQGVPLRISMDFRRFSVDFLTFCKGSPLGFPWIFVDFLGISKDFGGLAFVGQLFP